MYTMPNKVKKVFSNKIIKIIITIISIPISLKLITIIFDVGVDFGSTFRKLLELVKC